MTIYVAIVATMEKPNVKSILNNPQLRIGFLLPVAFKSNKLIYNAKHLKIMY